jgi:type IV secretory pathway VirB4 component
MADPFARRFLPQSGYWNETATITQDGALFAILDIAGHASDLASARAVIAARNRFKMTMINIADHSLDVSGHVERGAEHKPTMLPPDDPWSGNDHG